MAKGSSTGTMATQSPEEENKRLRKRVTELEKEREP